MPILYILQPDATLSKDYESFKVELKQEDGTWKKQNVPAQTVTEILLMGNPTVTGDALVYALELGITVHYLSFYGKYLGCVLPAITRNGVLRLAQHQLYQDKVRRLTLVKAIVKAKIQNQATVLSRRHQKENPLKSRYNLLKQKASIDEVRGVEGLAAREYFSYWQNILGEEWIFSGRNRRPPTDPVNSLLSFAYGLLRVQVTAAVNVAGLDPYIGYLHEVTRGQPSIVLDLMEEFRPLIADSVVLSVLQQRELQPKDFTESLGAYRLSDNARKQFLNAFERKMKDEFKHPIFDYRCNYRRAIELQARLLTRHLLENVPYKPLILH